MKKFTPSVLRLLLGIGVVLILAGMFCGFQVLTEFTEQLPISSVLISISGAIMIYLSLAVVGNAAVFFSGLYIFLIGCVSFFLTLQSFPNIQFRHLWPSFMVFCSICLFLTCIYKYKRLRTIYVFPAVLIFVLGAVFFLFSFGIVKFSFVNFISKWWPLMLIICGGVLVSMFLYQQTGNRFPYEMEDSADSTDAVGLKRRGSRGKKRGGIPRAHGSDE